MKLLRKRQWLVNICLYDFLKWSQQIHSLNWLSNSLLLRLRRLNFGGACREILFKLNRFVNVFIIENPSTSTVIKISATLMQQFAFYLDQATLLFDGNSCWVICDQLTIDSSVVIWIYNDFRWKIFLLLLILWLIAEFFWLYFL